MLRGLFRLIWLEIKIFLREPLGAIGTVVVPILIYLLLGGLFSRGRLASAPSTPFLHPDGPAPSSVQFLTYGIPTFVAIMIAINAVLSLVTIIAIYRESGILKRLRATPLRPTTILVTHVVVRLLFTAATMLAMIAAGRRYVPAGVHIPVVSFTLALLVSTWAILAVGFVIASLVRTARFAQPVTMLVFYPMLGVAGWLFPVALLSPTARMVSRLMPLTYVVSLLQGILKGDPWSAHLTDVAALVIVFAVATAVSSKVFRWE